MASISGNGARGRHKFTLNVNETGTNVVNNTSTVYYSFVLSPIQMGWNWNIGGISYKIVINGTTYSGTIQNYDGSSTVTLKSGTLVVGHNADGSKSISYSFSVTDSAGKTYTPGNASASGSLTLTKIPRQATITYAPNFTDEENPTINYNNPLGNNVNSLDACISLTGATDDITYRPISKTSTSYTFELTQDERNILLNACKNSNSLNVKFFVRTNIGGVNYHNSVTKTMTVINGNPVFENFIYREKNTKVSDLIEAVNVFVKDQSIIGVNIQENQLMQPVKKSTAKSYSITLGNVNFNIESTGEMIETEIPVKDISGTSRLSIRAYDSRNNSTEVFYEINVLDYAQPIINATAERQNNFDEETQIVINGSYSPLIFNNDEHNGIIDVSYRYRIKNGEWNDFTYITKTFSEGNYECPIIYINLDSGNAYDVEIKVEDSISETTRILNVDVGHSIFFISDNMKKCYINDVQVATIDDIGEINYVQGETAIGNWIDDKKVYRKIFVVNNLNNISTGITNIDTVIKLETMIKYGNQWRSFPWLWAEGTAYGNATYGGGLYYEMFDNSIRFQVGNYVKQNIQKAVVTIEYTKN